MVKPFCDTAPAAIIAFVDVNGIGRLVIFLAFRLHQDVLWFQKLSCFNLSGWRRLDKAPEDFERLADLGKGFRSDA